MKIPESAIERVVTEASQHLSEPSYISGQVDSFVKVQPAIMQYVVGHKSDLSVESIVQVLFHASLALHSVEAALKRKVGRVSFGQLDVAATKASSLEVLAETEPDLASFIHSNLDLDRPAENQLAGRLLAHVSRALVDACASSVP